MWLNIVETLAIFPAAFLLILVAVQVGLVPLRSRKYKTGYKPEISVIMPAHNEERYIQSAVESILNSDYKNLELIVVNDGSTDSTGKILSSIKDKRLRVLKTDHIGKSRAMNTALKKTTKPIVVTVDGDTVVEKGTLEKLVAPLSDQKIIASTGEIRVANRNRILTWFQKLEYAYGMTYYKHLCGKVGGILCTPGPLSAFRKKDVMKEDGFDDTMLLEDMDIAMRLIRSGKRIQFVPGAIAHNNVPEGFRSLAKQRVRWQRGTIQIIKKHKWLFFNKNAPGVGFFTFPLLTYWNFHSTFVLGLLILQILLGYNTYYLAAGQGFTMGAFMYFFNWFSVFGIINMSYQILVGNWALTLLSALNIGIAASTYALYAYSLRWTSEKVGLKDIVAFIFLFPYWLLVLFFQAISISEWFKGEGRNWWTK